MTIVRITFFVIALCFVLGVIFIIRAMQIPSRIKKAEELLENGDYSKASEITKEVLEKNKEFVPARYLRAKILIHQKQYLLAISELNGILSLSEFDKHVSELEIQYRLAELYQETQQWPKEIEAYKRILVFNPNDIRANHRLGHSQFKQKNYKATKEHLLEAYKNDSSLIDCIVPIGISSYYLGEYDDAEIYLLKAGESGQNAPEANFYLGQIYKKKRDFDNALRMFDNAKQNKKYFLRSQFFLGEIYGEMGDYDTAVGILEKGLGSVRGNDEEALAYKYLLAQCYEMANNIPEAVRYWEEIIKINENYRNTKSKLDDYKSILDNKTLKHIFTSTLKNLQPLLAEIISRMNFNIVSKKELSHNEYMFKAYSIKRINEPPILIYFNRTTQEITESHINNFKELITEEKCKNGIYMATAKFGIKAKSSAASKMIEIIDSSQLMKTMDKILKIKEQESNGS